MEDNKGSPDLSETATMKSRLNCLYPTVLLCTLGLTSLSNVAAYPSREFSIREFIDGKVQSVPLSKEEQTAYKKFKNESATTGNWGEQHKAGPQTLEVSRPFGVDTFTLAPKADQTAAISNFEKAFAAGHTKQALLKIQSFSIQDLHMFANRYFDYKLGLCLLDNGAYAQAVEYPERFAYYNNESIEGWRAMRLATKLSGKSFNSPELELGFAKNEGVHFPLNDRSASSRNYRRACDSK